MRGDAAEVAVLARKRPADGGRLQLTRTGGETFTEARRHLGAALGAAHEHQDQKDDHNEEYDTAADVNAVREQHCE